MEEQITQVQENVEVTPQVTHEEVRSKRAEDNLVAMRKRLEAEEEARKNAERRAQELESRYQNIPQNNPQVTSTSQEEDELMVDNEDYVQAKHVKTTNKKIKGKISEAEQKIADLERKLSYFEARMETSSVKDFDRVVSDDNLKTLARLYPEDYETLVNNPNLRTKSKTAYNMIKNYGIYSEHNSEEAQERITSNQNKPKAAAIVNPQAPATPLGRLSDYERRIIDDSEAKRIMDNWERKKQLAGW